MMRSLFVFGLLAAFCLALAVAGVANDKQAARAACRDDYLRFCSSVPRGQGRVLACLQSHAQALTPTCRAIVEERIAAKKAATN